MKAYFYLFIFAMLNIHCTGSTMDQNQDSIPKPNFLSNRAVILNFGGGEMPIYVWADASNYFENDSINYAHIIGIKYYYVSSGIIDTVYYENLKLRSGHVKINLSGIKILSTVSDAGLTISFNNDTLHLFRATQFNGLESLYEGKSYVRVPVVNSVSPIGLIYNGDISLYMENMDDTYCLVYVYKSGEKLSTIKYRKYNACIVKKNAQVSFLDKTNGRIYFIEKECYIDPLDKASALKILLK